MAFDSRDTGAFKGVWVFCEQCEGEADEHGLRADQRGPEAGGRPGRRSCAACFWATTWRAWRRSWAATARTRCMCASMKLLETYTTDGYAKVICDLVEEKKPEIFLIGATNIGRDLVPAARPVCTRA